MPVTGTRHASLYTMRELNQRTAEVIKEINESGEPAIITRRGRIVAMIKPLASADIESAVLGAVLAAAHGTTAFPRETGEPVNSAQAAEELDVVITTRDGRRVEEPF